MDCSIFTFEFEDCKSDVRFVDGKPVANDVAKILGYVDPVNTVRKKVDSEFKGVAILATPGGVQSITDYAYSKNLKFGYIYSWVYREFRDRYHIDLVARGKNCTLKMNGIQYASVNNLLDNLYAVTLEILI